MKNTKHLIWIPIAAVVSFLTSFFFGDVLTLPVDIYYLIYFTVMFGYFYLYIRVTDLHLKNWITPRIGWAVLAGILVGILMMKNVLSRPETAQFQGFQLWWAIFWRGLMYGLVDGLLLFAFPWIVTWRAFRASERHIAGKIRVALLAWIFTLLITTTYHLGYGDFRSQKIIQPNIGSTITIVPTLVTLNPVASTLSHVFLHVTAVVHSPKTDLFLPPHREALNGSMK